MRTEADALLSVQRFFAGVFAAPWEVRTDLETGDPPQRPFILIELAGPGETTGAPVTQDIVLPIVANFYLAAASSREAATDASLAVREQVWQAVKWGPDPTRPTTDRLPLYCYDPRVEQHRFANSSSAPFTITVDGATTLPLVPPVLATDVAAAIEAALIGHGVAVTPGDLVGQDRGSGLWDVFYGGSLAGVRVGDPTISAGSARTILQGAPAPWRAPSDYMRVAAFTQNTVRDVTDPKLAMVAVDLRLTFARGLPLPLGLRILQRVSATVGSGPGG